MSRITLALSAILLIILGGGCSAAQETDMPTPLPMNYIPTAVQLTLDAGATTTYTATPVSPPVDFPPITPSPTEEFSAMLPPPSETSPSQPQNSPTFLANDQTVTPSPTQTDTTTPDANATSTPRPTRTPSPTRTPTIPPAGVQINSPGPMSRVASPLEFTGNIHSQPSGNYIIELWIEPLQPGGQPRMLYREVQRIISSPIDWLYLDQKIEFELDRVSEYGQLRISVLDSFGRATSINSVDLILLQLGSSDITPPMLKSDPLVIREPFPNKLIQGGVVTVTGLAMPDQEYLHVQLVTVDGTVVGAKDQAISPDPAGGYVPYTIDVPYSVVNPTWVRLQLSESNTRIAGIDHLSSVQILLGP
jgi:hypothetical protein